MGKDLRCLKSAHQPGEAALLDRIFSYHPPCIDHRSGQRTEESRNDVKERALAGTVGTNQAGDCMLGNRKGYIAEDMQSSEPVGNVSNLKNVAHSSCDGPRSDKSLASRPLRIVNNIPPKPSGTKMTEIMSRPAN